MDVDQDENSLNDEISSQKEDIKRYNNTINAWNWKADNAIAIRDYNKALKILNRIEAYVTKKYNQICEYNAKIQAKKRPGNDDVLSWHEGINKQQKSKHDEQRQLEIEYMSKIDQYNAMCRQNQNIFTGPQFLQYATKINELEYPKLLQSIKTRILEVERKLEIAQCFKSTKPKPDLFNIDSFDGEHENFFNNLALIKIIENDVFDATADFHISKEQEDAIINKSRFIIAKIGDLPVGYTRWSVLNNGDVAICDRMCLLQNYRGFKLGNLLLKELIQDVCNTVLSLNLNLKILVFRIPKQFDTLRTVLLNKQLVLLNSNLQQDNVAYFAVGLPLPNATGSSEEFEIHSNIAKTILNI